MSKHDIQDYHRLGKTDPKNTIVRFVNRKFCYEALDNKLNLRKVDMIKLGAIQVLFIQASAILYFSKNLTHYNQLGNAGNSKEQVKFIVLGVLIKS